LVGDAAKNQAPMNPTNTVFDAKRLIGRKVDEADVVNDIKHFPFKIVGKDGKPIIQVKVKGEDKRFTPEEISAMVLGKMKDIAESYLGEKVTHAGKIIFLFSILVVLNQSNSCDCSCLFQ
jgi:endoplasmic reticulum chaperone BiP